MVKIKFETRSTHFTTALTLLQSLIELDSDSYIKREETKLSNYEYVTTCTALIWSS